MESAGQTIKISSVRLPVASFLIGLVGVALSMWGASWDITSHLLRIPETFFTPSHMVLYTGVGISMISALLSIAVLIRKRNSVVKPFILGSKLVIVGAILQIIAGPGDFYWHEIFGIDGLLSPTHIALAIGILIVSVGTVIGFTRIQSHLEMKNNLIKIIIPIAFGVFWFAVMWMVFFFVLPISDGDTHNFNPDESFAVILSFVVLPFLFSILFWTMAKSQNVFGVASAATLAFITMNTTSNILTSEDLLSYLPWFVAPIASAIAADYILSGKINSRILKNHQNKISGLILGSMFFMFCFPMLAMTFLEPYLFNDVFSYDVLHSSSEKVFEIWLITIIPGAVAGMLGMMFASRKLGKRLLVAEIK